MNGDWTDDAACRDITNIERDRYFYPGSSGRPAPDTAYDYGRVRWCRNCPITDQCRQQALDNGEQHGLWGGTTPAQRRQLLGENPTINHGTRSGYAQHWRHGEPPCHACTVADRIYRAEYDARRAG